MSPSNNHDNPLTALNPESLGAIHRQWIRANLIRDHFRQALAESPEPPGEFDTSYFIQPKGIFMYLWYALLFSSLEACCEHNIDLSFLTALDQDLYESLRVLRNTVFHVPKKDYWDNRMFEVMAQPDAVTRLHGIHDGLGNALLAEMKRRQSSK